MQNVFLAVFLLGLILGVLSMLIGIDRTRKPWREHKAGLLNLPTGGAFFTALGVTGYLAARYSTWTPSTNIGLGLLTGVAAAAGAFGMLFGWAVPSAKKEVEDERYLLQGYLGQVTRAVGATTPGEISYEENGKHHLVSARGLNDAPIAVGTEIVIERVENGVAFVELWETIEKQL